MAARESTKDTNEEKENAHELTGIDNDAQLVTAIERFIKNRFDWDQLPGMNLLTIVKRDTPGAYAFWPQWPMDGTEEDVVKTCALLAANPSGLTHMLASELNARGGKLHAIGLIYEAWMVNCHDLAGPPPSEHPGRRETRHLLLLPVDGAAVEIARVRGVGDMPDEFRDGLSAYKPLIMALELFSAAMTDAARVGSERERE